MTVSTLEQRHVHTGLHREAVRHNRRFRADLLPPSLTPPRSDHISAALEPFRRFSSVLEIIEANAEHAQTRQAKKVGLLSVVFSVCIITVVTCATCAFAAAIVYMSVVDAHSNIRVVTRLVRGPAAVATNAAVAIPALPPSVEASPLPSCGGAAVPCVEDLLPAMLSVSECDAQNSVSIVNFLDARTLPSSFGDREELAHAYALRDYRGTAVQNRQLLHILQQDISFRCHRSLADSV